ncbi:MAG: hypothetical protein JXX28_19120 [Deltaproteobacteria bacterium]|nr:hypothetical protein [Deltaproteobacteria bacterium]
MRGAPLALAALLLGTSCSKVPISDVQAGFALADASWFAEEETLFLFYQVEAEQGLGEPSVVEVRYTTDQGGLDWTPITELPTVHTHLPVDCGPNTLCGSASLAVPLEPREVALRLRYHRDGALALNAATVFNAVGEGPAYTHRSLTLYGVFDEENQRIQWRGRHRFPTIRNEQAEALGLRREFWVEGVRYGDATLSTPRNPYGYDAACPDAFSDAGLSSVHTDARAVFHAQDLPLDAADASIACGEATVTDALGTFTAGAVARKNPEVRAAFPVLRSPIAEARPIQFMLGPCDDEFSEEHEAMQRQRLQLGGVPTWCIDDWQTPGFVEALEVALSGAVEAARPAGEDMVLVIGLHQDEPGVTAAVEEALARVVPAERHRSTPRLVGAFVFDSATHGIALPELSPVTLWCPAKSTGSDTSSQTCPTMPDLLNLDLGPFTFDLLPILPSRTKYLEFLETYSVSQGGEVTALHYLAPEFATTSEHIDLGEYGVVTFLNGETFPADADDAFSYCERGDTGPIVVRSRLMRDPEVQEALSEACWEGQVPDSLCGWLGAGMLPISSLPDWHNILREDSYELGLFWEFPFLLRMEYRMVIAGSATAFGLTVPFGVGSPAESYYGSAQWAQESFSLDQALSQCRRFCDHPTFDSAGVYHVLDPFRTTYANACYGPDYPVPGDSGFPVDP